MRHWIALESVPTTPWKNGGGVTRQILWADDSLESMDAVSQRPWTLRISVADITASGPFSIFPGVDRWISPLEGGGVSLVFADQGRSPVALRRGEFFAFDGDESVACELDDDSAPARDLNIMARRGSWMVRPLARTWDSVRLTSDERLLWTPVVGRWQVDGVSVGPGHVLWCAGEDVVGWFAEGSAEASWAGAIVSRRSSSPE